MDKIKRKLLHKYFLYREKRDYGVIFQIKNLIAKNKTNIKE